MVKSWRLYLKLSPSAVAKELGCSLQKYQELEKKETLFASTLARLSGIFNVGIQQLQSID